MGAASAPDTHPPDSDPGDQEGAYPVGEVVVITSGKGGVGKTTMSPTWAWA